MGYIQIGIPRDLVLNLLEAQPTSNFIETGTFSGGTTFWAAEHFRKVVTIEINPELSQAAAARGCPSNIEFLVGNSGELMSEVVSKLDGPAVFWLDGHYSGPGTGGNEAECPIMDELAAIRSSSNPVVLIDDARCFFGPPPPPHNPDHWVNIDRIFLYFAAHFPNHFVTIHDDVIIAVPSALKSVIDEDWLRKYDERFAILSGKRRTLIQRAIGRILS